MTTTHTVIVGAGPAGLAIGARLRQLGIPFILLEKSDSVGVAWRNHYDRLHLHTDKRLSHLPFEPFAKELPRYVPRQEVYNYLRNYAQKYDLRPILHTNVTNISRNGSDWEVHTEQGETYRAVNVVVTTGLNNRPIIPHFARQDEFTGQILHSNMYKNPAPYTGKRVLVIGFGNTGAEIALDLAEAGVNVTALARSPMFLMPRDFLGMSVQYLGVVTRRSPNFMNEFTSKLIQKVSYPDLTPFNLSIDPMSPLRNFRLNGESPLLDLGTIQAVREGKIKIIKGLQHFTSEGIVTDTGENRPVDAVILATGFRTILLQLIENAERYINEKGHPRQLSRDGLHFIGFDNTRVGGVLRNIHDDSALVANTIAQTHARTVSEPTS